MRKIKNFVLYIIFIVCVILLFAGKPGFYTARSSLYLWNLGHIFLFALASIILIKEFRFFNKLSFIKQLIFIVIFSLFFGIITELLQVEFDRTPDVEDLIRDVLGSVLGVAFFSPARRTISKLTRRIIQYSLIVLTLIEVYPFTAALADEVLALSQFPLLSDFETPLEIDRWQNHSQLQVKKGLSRNGKCSMQVELTTSKYSGVALKYFPNNWAEYSHFKFSIYNPDNDTLRIVCRIHDQNHIHSYSDRFNKAFYAKNGWNDFTVPIDIIESAPKERKMDLEKIESIGIFTVRSTRKRIIYLDSFYLSN